MAGHFSTYVQTGLHRDVADRMVLGSGAWSYTEYHFQVNTSRQQQGEQRFRVSIGKAGSRLPRTNPQSVATAIVGLVDYKQVHTRIHVLACLFSTRMEYKVGLAYWAIWQCQKGWSDRSVCGPFFICLWACFMVWWDGFYL